MTVVERERQAHAFAMQTALLALAALVGSLFGGGLPGLIADIYDFTLDDPEPYRYTLMVVALCLLPIALTPNWWSASLGYISALAMTNLRYAAFIVYIMVLVPRRQQAMMAGAGEAAAGFSFALVALVGGYLVDWSGFRELFLFGAALSGLGTLVFWLHLRGDFTRNAARLRPVP